MRKGLIALHSLALSASLLAGCSTANYRGASPSARTLSESPAIKDYYVGMNLNFSLDQPEKYHHTPSGDTSTAVVSGEPAARAQATTSVDPKAD